MTDATTGTRYRYVCVNTDDVMECRYWCEEFGVRPKELKRAVREVGNRPEDVRHQLQHLANAQIDTTG